MFERLLKLERWQAKMEVRDPFARYCLDGWGQTNVAAGQSNVRLDRYGLADQYRNFVPPRSGSITGIGIFSTEARTAGTLTVEAFVNAVSTGFTVVLDATNPSSNTAKQAAGLDVFGAGARLDLRIITDGSWSPTTADIICSMEVTYD